MKRGTLCSGLQTLHLPLYTALASLLTAKDNREPIHFPIQSLYVLYHNAICRAVRRVCAQQG